MPPLRDLQVFQRVVVSMARQVDISHVTQLGVSECAMEVIPDGGTLAAMRGVNAGFRAVGMDELELRLPVDHRDSTLSQTGVEVHAVIPGIVIAQNPAEPTCPGIEHEPFGQAFPCVPAGLLIGIEAFEASYPIVGRVSDVD